MIQIDISMPESCTKCPCFSGAVYGKCNANQKWMGASESPWHSKERPKWCPLKEVKPNER